MYPFLMTVSAVFLACHAHAIPAPDDRPDPDEFARLVELVQDKVRADILCIATYRAEGDAIAQVTVACHPASGAFIRADAQGVICRTPDGSVLVARSPAEPPRPLDTDMEDAGFDLALVDQFPTTVFAYLLDHPDAIREIDFDDSDASSPTVVFEIPELHNPGNPVFTIELAGDGTPSRLIQDAEGERKETRLEYAQESLPLLPLTRSYGSGKHPMRLHTFEYRDLASKLFEPANLARLSADAYQYQQRRIAEISAKLDRQKLALQPGEKPRARPDSGSLAGYRAPLFIAAFIILLLAGYGAWHHSRG